MSTFRVSWRKEYFASGDVVIEAKSLEEAKTIAQDQIGNYTGSMEYDPSGDFVEAIENPH